MAAQKVVISKDLKADLQAFFASMSYDKLFILTDTNTQEKCYPLIKDIPALQDTPVITVQYPLQVFSLFSHPRQPPDHIDPGEYQKSVFYDKI